MSGASIMWTALLATLLLCSVPDYHDGSRRLFLHLDVTPKSVGVGGSVTATLTMGIRKVELEGPVLGLRFDLLRLIDRHRSHLAMFTDAKGVRTDVLLLDSEGSEHGYEVFRFAKDIPAEELGDMKIGPVHVWLRYPTAAVKGFFGDTFITESEDESATATAVHVQVDRAGRTAGFRAKDAAHESDDGRSGAPGEPRLTSPNGPPIRPTVPNFLGGDFRIPRSAIRGAATSDQTDAQHHFVRGYLDARERNYDKAIACFDQTISLDPDYTDAYINRGVAYAAKGDNARAIADYDLALRLSPGDAPTLLNRGVAYLAMGLHDQAIADFSRGIELSPNSANGFGQRGAAYAAVGRHNMALADFTKAIALEPDHVEAFIGRGASHMAMGQYAESIADTTQAIALNPMHARAMANRCSVYILTRDIDRAIRDCTAAIEIDPKYAPARLGRGLALVAQEEPKKAISDFSVAIELEPGNVDALSARGLVYRELREHDNARADLQRVLALNPTGPRGRAARDILRELPSKRD